MAKKTEVTYTPEELAEIDRILKVLTEEPDIPEFPEQERVFKPSQDEDFDIEKEDENIPDDLHFDDELTREERFEPEETVEPETLDVEEGFLEESPEGGQEAEFEPEEIYTLDDSDIKVIDEAEEQEGAQIEGFDEIEDIPSIEEPTAARKKQQSIVIEGEDEIALPSFDELDIKEPEGIPEIDEMDIPEVNLEDLPGASQPASSETPEGPDEFLSSQEDFASLEEAESKGFEEEEQEISPRGESAESALDEFDSFEDAGFEDISNISDSEKEAPAASSKKAQEAFEDAFSHEDESFTIEPLDDDHFDHIVDEEVHESPKPQGGGQTLELSDRDLAKLKKAIILFNPAIRDAIKDTIINDRLSYGDTKRLVDMILAGKPEDNIHRFLEKKLKTKIELREETVAGRRVIASRPEYTLEGRERQKRLLKATRIFGVTVILTFFITILSYQFIYKPYMAKKLIGKGVQLIIKSGVAGNRFERKQNYDEAERIFKEVDEEYVKDYIYGYNEYARAYLLNGDYKESLEKLNRAYDLDRANIDTLNNLGYFYAKVSNEYFSYIAKDIKNWYFKDRTDLETIKTPLDLAINFYRRVLLLDKENITALVGIGNAYFYQGQYLKAKKYYEDILRVNPKSIAGYSGLLNLYIERNAFPMVAQTHAQLREKEMLADLPSPLLSKLAGYYLDKRAMGDSNVRIDYGVTTKKLIDEADNTYPAILEVLKALNDRDPDYPQLHIQYAKLSIAQNNLMAAKRYIDKALSLAPNYYSALHLMGEYYYITKEPVKSYRYLKEAIDNYGNQPAFTREDFYKETEHIGKSNTYIGNIFYYFFDKVKSREGALEEEFANNEIEKMANYTIAEQYYINAVNQGYASSELYYNLGRIYYLKKNYSLALNSWLHLYDDFIKSPELMLSLGNAFYYNNNINAAKGEYLKLISVFEYEADKIKVADPSRVEHIKIFQTLSSAYNNLGVAYNDLGEFAKRDLAYWKSIDYGLKLNRENEYARVNMARSNRNNDREGHLIDESIPYSIDIYMENMRN
ncbi:MAG: tetratricopeptide repeat protein [Spirochaetes bacterium]|jgi:tetratricopeptide (TPR) repeat protein|nr:tetratricopeptide repeat protein [Spirochaetota bacterium]